MWRVWVSVVIFGGGCALDEPGFSSSPVAPDSDDEGDEGDEDDGDEEIDVGDAGYVFSYYDEVVDFCAFEDGYVHAVDIHDEEAEWWGHWDSSNPERGVSLRLEGQTSATHDVGYSWDCSSGSSTTDGTSELGVITLAPGFVLTWEMTPTLSSVKTLSYTDDWPTNGLIEVDLVRVSFDPLLDEAEVTELLADLSLEQVGEDPASGARLVSSLEGRPSAEVLYTLLTDVPEVQWGRLIEVPDDG